MNKLLLIISLLLGVNLFADLVNDGLKEYEKGNKQKAKELYTKACDGVSLPLNQTSLNGIIHL